jgi:hypothetical protein
MNYINKKVALFTNARDEKHIKEWAAHHLLIGFDHIFIFDHKSKVPITNIFKNFDKRVVIKNVSHLNSGIKMNLMNYAASIGKKINVDWMIYLDADEFLIINDRFRGVKHFLNHYNHAHSLGVNWLMFGSNNLVNDPDGLILENYTKSSLLLHQHVKSFVRPKEIVNSNNPHFYNIKQRSRMFGINNRVITNCPAFNKHNIPYNESTAYIAHYVNQSEETFITRKLLLPRDDTGKMRGSINVKQIHNEFNDHENLQPKIKYADKVKQFIAYNS